MKKISLVACGLLLSSSMAFGADSIDDAFKSGTVSGDITLYGLQTDRKGGKKDVGFSAATTGLAYETASYMGLNAKMGFRAGHVFGNSADFENDALMTEAYVKYATDGIALSVGRQEIDLEWLGDYNESVVAAITAIPNTTIVLGYVDRQAAADEDEIGTFGEITEDGAYVADIKYSGIEGVELNPYFYSAVDVADFYGLKAGFSTDTFGVIAQYAASSEETGPDGSIANFEISTGIADLSLAAGYITTDSEGGVGSIAAYGDNVTPFDNGDDNYETDADTVYGSAEYSIGNATAGVLYGETEFGSSESSELNLYSSYALTDSLSLGLLYVNYDLEGSDSSDYQDFAATLAYEF